MKRLLCSAIVGLVLMAHPSQAAEPAELKLVGEWDVEVRSGSGPRSTAIVSVTPPEWVVVADEQHSQLPVFNPRAGGWVKGAQLRGVRAQETTTPFLVDTNSLIVRTAANGGGELLARGRDFEADLTWGTIGRLTNGALRAGQPVWVSYRHAQLRLDSVVMTEQGRIELRRGEPRAAAPSAPTLPRGERLLANIWLPGRLARLSAHHLFPVLEESYPEPPGPPVSPAEALLPGTLARLRSGEKLRILAWGDSVTDAGYLPGGPQERWQAQFVARLRGLFPKANIELVTEAWGGRNTYSYTNEPPGSPHNYREKVLGARPHLVVSEFVNDAGLSPRQVEERYSLFLADFKAIGAEWIILTPHYVRPDWMGLDRERDIDDDPRPYVAGVRQFGQRHGVAVADASRRYGRLWRQGLPYTALMLNSINHPDARGMKLFADALMVLFPAR